MFFTAELIHARIGSNNSEFVYDVLIHGTNDNLSTQLTFNSCISGLQERLKQESKALESATGNAVGQQYLQRLLKTAETISESTLTSAVNNNFGITSLRELF